MRVSVPQNESSVSLNRWCVNRYLSFAFFVLVMLFFSFPAHAQNTVRVRGHVATETGQPIPKASVIVKGTTNGVTGSDNGDFEIDAPANGTLVVSSVGYSRSCRSADSFCNIKCTQCKSK
jgi:hypothetical protein